MQEQSLQYLLSGVRHRQRPGPDQRVLGDRRHHRLQHRRQQQQDLDEEHAAAGPGQHRRHHRLLRRRPHVTVSTRPRVKESQTISKLLYNSH